MKLVSRIGVLAVSLLVTGCAANYRVPPGSPSAEMIFSTNKGAQTFVGLWKIPTETCPDAKKVALLLEKQTGVNETSVFIEAGSPFLVNVEMASFAYPIGPRTCNAAGIFTPEPKMIYRLQHVITNSGCGIDLLSISPTGWTREASFRPLAGNTESQICSSLNSN